MGLAWARLAYEIVPLVFWPTWHDHFADAGWAGDEQRKLVSCVVLPLTLLPPLAVYLRRRRRSTPFTSLGLGLSLWTLFWIFGAGLLWPDRSNRYSALNQLTSNEVRTITSARTSFREGDKDDDNLKGLQEALELLTSRLRDDEELVRRVY